MVDGSGAHARRPGRARPPVPEGLRRAAADGPRAHAGSTNWRRQCCPSRTRCLKPSPRVSTEHGPYAGRRRVHRSCCGRESPAFSARVARAARRDDRGGACGVPWSLGNPGVPASRREGRVRHRCRERTLAAMVAVKRRKTYPIPVTHCTGSSRTPSRRMSLPSERKRWRSRVNVATHRARPVRRSS